MSFFVKGMTYQVDRLIVNMYLRWSEINMLGTERYSNSRRERVWAEKIRITRYSNGSLLRLRIQTPGIKDLLKHGYCSKNPQHAGCLPSFVKRALPKLGNHQHLKLMSLRGLRDKICTVSATHTPVLRTPFFHTEEPMTL